ncbi:hypothetical protein HW132_34565, partial [Brasilonema sp. CT11]|nr:hypothetical protein [Brasilonema sp. CT11]
KTFKINPDPDNPNELPADPRFAYDEDFVQTNVAPAFLNKMLDALEMLINEGIDYGCTTDAFKSMQKENNHLFQFCEDIGLDYVANSSMTAGEIWLKLEEWYKGNGTLVEEGDRRIWNDQVRPSDKNVKAPNQVLARFAALFPKATRNTRYCEIAKRSLQTITGIGIVAKPKPTPDPVPEPVLEPVLEPASDPTPETEWKQSANIDNTVLQPTSDFSPLGKAQLIQQWLRKGETDLVSELVRTWKKEQKSAVKAHLEPSEIEAVQEILKQNKRTPAPEVDTPFADASEDMPVEYIGFLSNGDRVQCYPTFEHFSKNQRMYATVSNLETETQNSKRWLKSITLTWNNKGTEEKVTLGGGSTDWILGKV